MDNERAWRCPFTAMVCLVLGMGTLPAFAQPTTWEAESVDPDEQLPTGKRVTLCPNLRLPANHASLKVVALDGAVYGSGLTGQRPSLAKCVNGRVVWQRALNTIPASIDGLWNAALFAGMTPGNKVALGVGEVDQNGKEKWFRKIDTPGDELGAVTATGSGKLGFSYYVLSGSTGQVAGQPAKAKGYRFLAAFSPHDKTPGKQRWVKQSRDFGRAPDPRGSGGDGTPVALAADSRDGVYVLLGLDPERASADKSGLAQVAKLTKLDAKGKQVFQRAIRVDAKALAAQSLRGTLQAIAVDGDGSSIYVAGKASVGSRPRILVMRLDGMGAPRWTNLVSLQYAEQSRSDDGSTMEVYGDLGEIRGIAVSGDTVLVVAEYGNEFQETWESEGDEEEEMLGMGEGSRDYNEVAAVASLDSLHGKLRWARQYEGLGPEYHGASAFRPGGIDVLPGGEVALIGSEDIWVAQQGQRFEDVPALFQLSDVEVASSYDAEPPTAAELEFYEQLRAAVKRGDKNWVADHTNFPLCCTFPGGKKVPDKTTFLKRYAEIFNERVLESIEYTKVGMVYRDRGGNWLETSDMTLSFGWVEAKGGRKAGYYVVNIDNELRGGEEQPTSAPPPAVTKPNTASGASTAGAKKNESTESEAAKPAAESASTSNRDKIKNWFKDQHRQALEKSKQEEK